MTDARNELADAISKMRIAVMQSETSGKAVVSHLSRAGTNTSAVMDNATDAARVVTEEGRNLMEAAERVQGAVATAGREMDSVIDRAERAGVESQDADARAGEAREAVHVARAAVWAFEKGLPGANLDMKKVSWGCLDGAFVTCFSISRAKLNSTTFLLFRTGGGLGRQ